MYNSNMIMNVRKKFFRIEESPKTKAQGMVEFALVLPILLLIIFGTIEFGRMIAFQSSVTLASREAARYAASVGEVSGTPHYADCGGIIDAAAGFHPLLSITWLHVADT